MTIHTHNPPACAIIIARAGSKGLPGKNERRLGGRPMVAYSLDAARDAVTIKRTILSTDSAAIAETAHAHDVEVVNRPAALASDTATVDDAVRHAVQSSDVTEPIVVILYANVPIRPSDLIDRAVRELIISGADSVQSYTLVGKHHPHWMVQLAPGGRVQPHVDNAVYRRQDLPELLIPDGGVIAVTRDVLFAAGEHPHSFLGNDRRGIRTEPGAVVDIDCEVDFIVAESTLDRMSAGAAV